MEDWDADLSPCNFTTFHFPTVSSRTPIWQRAFWSFSSLELRDPWNRGPCRNALYLLWICFLAFFREFLKALETTTAVKRHKISCSCGSDCWASDSSFHGCWLGIVVVWWLLWVQLLPLNDGRVEKSSFHGCYRLGTPGGWIGTF